MMYEYKQQGHEEQHHRAVPRRGTRIEACLSLFETINNGLCIPPTNRSSQLAASSCAKNFQLYFTSFSCSLNYLLVCSSSFSRNRPRSTLGVITSTGSSRVVVIFSLLTRIVAVGAVHQGGEK